VLASVAGAAAALVVILGLVMIFGRGGDQAKQKPVAQGAAETDREPTTAEATSSEPTEPETHLILRWSESDRGDAELQIDGVAYDLATVVDESNAHQLKLPLQPGSHKVWIARRGFEPFEETVPAPGEEQPAPVGEAAPPPEPPAEPATPEPTAPQVSELEAALAELEKLFQAEQQADARYTGALAPAEALVAAWDFAGALAALEKVRFDEPELAARLALRRDEIGRLAGLKSRMIEKIIAARPPLEKKDLGIRGAGGQVLGADASGVTTKLRTGKEEQLPWSKLGSQATGRLLELVIDAEQPDDWLSAGLFAYAVGDAALGQRLLDEARARGAGVEPYRTSVASVGLKQAIGLVIQGEPAKADTGLEPPFIKPARSDEGSLPPAGGAGIRSGRARSCPSIRTW
jgi:hypothetical protein